MEKVTAAGTSFKPYVSFNYADSRLVDTLEGDLKAYGIKLARYEHGINYQDDILAFIQELKGARFVFVVLSEEYFDSEICLLELAASQKARDRHISFRTVIQTPTSPYSLTVPVSVLPYESPQVTQTGYAMP